MAKVLIPTALQQYAGGTDELEIPGGSVQAVLDHLAERYPDLKKHLFDDKGKLRQFVNLYKGSEDTRSLQGMATPLAESDELSIVPSIAGGTGTIDRVTPNAPRSMPESSGVISPRREEAATLDNDEILRYSRHLILPEVGMEGQKRLKAAKVLCIGAGGLGAPLALYLAAAGVGTIGIVDFDVVDYTNLQRQVIHGTKDVGRPKLTSAKETIQDINPHVEVIGFEDRFTSD
ncbi:MAG TPA: ThiF family adenylyltransferase, partial [Chthonomonadaceae bacterium]|nr:ThiF family adenylyltransferase [Chthonomonadaceae bacterium]